jgi:predicted heme/steroid binding protein
MGHGSRCCGGGKAAFAERRGTEVKTQFNGAGGLPTYISFTQGADDMSDHDEWMSCSHWGMFPTHGNN